MAQKSGTYADAYGSLLCKYGAEVGNMYKLHENPHFAEYQRSRDSQSAEPTPRTGRQRRVPAEDFGFLQTMFAMQVYLAESRFKINKKVPEGLVCLAQKSGFEPEVAFTTPAFQASTLDRSDTSA